MKKLYSDFPTIDYATSIEGKETNIKLRDINYKFTLASLSEYNLAAYYPYTHTDEDRVDNLSYFYYDSPYDYWLVMMSNEAYDIHSDFRTPDNIIHEALYIKYKLDAIADDVNDNINDVVAYLQQKVYQYFDADGDVVDITTWQNDTSGGNISYYDFEVKKNDDKRNLLLFDKVFKKNVYRQISDKLIELNK
jgi:hypothetical protein